jgi:hypothetical protein
MTATDTAQAEMLHETSLAVWDIPTPAAGQRFTVKVGAKSSAGCALGGCRIEVLDGEIVVASGRLGDEPWPGTGALYWAEVELRAPQMPRPVALTVRFDAAHLDEPHQDASSPFSVPVVARPDHTLTVTVAAHGIPIEEAYIRLGPYRATTGASGQATLEAAKGRYELVVWKAGYDTDPVPVEIDSDASINVEARRCRSPIPTRSGRRERRDIGAGL